MARLSPQEMRLVVKRVLNNNFTFADLSNRFKNVDSSTGNIFCPFHENHESPAAKMYWDAEREIWVIHCFGECHQNFTAYDYVDLILCRRYNRYKSPLDFLKQNISLSSLYTQLESGINQLSDWVETRSQAKEDYINKVAEDNESTEDYIEALYTA